MTLSEHSDRSAAGTACEIAIIGAGFAGIGMAIRLLQAGIESFALYERASEIGGTWRDNTYPGAACDVPSHVYSLSFEPNPHWSHKYAGSREIHDYLLRLVDKWRLRSRLHLDTGIVGARFDEQTGLWRLESDAGDTFSARVVVSCVGGFSNPAQPDIPGLADFSGARFHTARWRHDVSLAGRRVAVIGTGASAVQVVPAIAPEVGALTVFQRSAPWVLCKRDRPYSERKRRFFARFPWALAISRFRKYLVRELFGPVIYRDSKRLSQMAEKRSLAHLHAQVQDPELRARLTPDFQFGCKRVLLSDDYWATFERDNVELVTEPIEAVRERGIETASGRLRECDVIVLATGFVQGLATAPFAIVGRAGHTLAEEWADGASAFLGMSVAGFPNWFTLMGPNTGPGHTSVLVYTEAQISHVLGAIRLLRRGQVKYVEVRREVQERYQRLLDRRMRKTSWSSGCNSWYLSEDGQNHALYPGLAAEYVWRARRFKRAQYQLVSF